MLKPGPVTNLFLNSSTCLLGPQSTKLSTCLPLGIPLHREKARPDEQRCVWAGRWDRNHKHGLVKTRTHEKASRSSPFYFLSLLVFYADYHHLQGY